MTYTYKLIFFFILSCLEIASAQSLPKPDHIVIVILENHGYNQIYQSPATPFINSLSKDSSSAVFHRSFALQHPSQPNYLDLFAGCNQGVNDNNVPLDTPLVTPNLGRQLLDAGYTFATYSEDLPWVGFSGVSYAYYVRRHNPAANWVGHGTNQLPVEINQPFSAFPGVDFSTLPTVSLVIPNLIHDMHDGADPERMATGDEWLKNNLSKYVDWAKTHNSLFILTFDEDNSVEKDHILTLFTGDSVKAGHYYQHINHYNVLRTIEDMYGLPYACNAATATPILSCWSSSDGGAVAEKYQLPVIIFPNPSNGAVQLQLISNQSQAPVRFTIFNSIGIKIEEGTISDFGGLDSNRINLDPGVYFIRLNNGAMKETRKLIVQ